ncbi:Piwi-domain-containing protein [Rhizodiscina lignyota]|uniref:Piwi-domain-containing protein n=1 Tax=Rhizodiscina lignyota TaxID=1504668 RepID=A0A9P4INV4_9PEZI|nr:Piwi-domain-containing protein [Rhizodiscina lignyota]
MLTFQDALGFDVITKLLRVPAKTLVAPTIQFGDKPSVTPACASWDLRETKFVKPGRPLKQLGIVGLYYEKPLAQPPFLDMAKVAENAIRTLRGHGITIEQETPVLHSQHIPCLETQEQYLDKLKKIFETFFDTYSEMPLALVILPEKSQALYAAIKKITETQLAKMTICCQKDKLSTILTKIDKGATDPFFSNLALKFNFKLGGDTHHINVDKHTERLNADTIMFGGDVTHPRKGDHLATPSIASLVGSVDPHFINIPGSLRLQSGRQEIISDILDMSCERFLAWSRCTAENDGPYRLPQNVLYYRDGVGETQYQTICDEELTAIGKGSEKAFEALGDNLAAETAETPLITCVVAGKRHHARFYPLSNNQTYPSKSGKKPTRNARFEKRGMSILWKGALNGNVKPGLVIEDVITHPEDGDFYLQSHDAIKGTGRSAHYYPIKNDIGLTSQEIQAITHRMCYSYSPATKGISYCAPAYCADKLCTRGRFYLGAWDSNARAANGLIRQGKEEKDEAFKLRVAQHLQNSAFWIDSQSTTSPGNLEWKNPWKQDLQDVMFYV